jgi:hypothetical protein
MDMKRILLSSLLGLSLILQAGCRMVVVNGKRLEGMAGIRLTGPNDPINGSYWAKDIQSANLDGSNQMDGDTKQRDPFRIKYHSSHSANRWMAVEGRLGNGREYPVVLDTGASIALFVNDVHIMENQLAIYPLKSNDSVGWGRCYLPELNIGQVTLANWPCFYREQHTEVQLLGLPLAKGKAIIAGLAALRRFKYIAFDSVRKEVEFSLGQAFKLAQLDLWTQYSFAIEEDLGGNVFLFVKIPIAGEEIELQLDTGSGRGLAIAEELWERMRKRIHYIKLRKGRDLYPYIGWLACKQGVAPKLEVGNRTLENAMISVFPNDSPIVDQCSGLLGMQYFQDTTVALDFERNLMWVKNSPSR